MFIFQYFISFISYLVQMFCFQMYAILYAHLDFTDFRQYLVMVAWLILCIKAPKDNDSLTPQIQTLYSLLQVQIHAGVPMIDALTESYLSFPPGRLRNALNDFTISIYFNGSFDKSLRELNAKFDNGFIDSLCIILLQARESGQAMELLRDISQQITDMQASLQLKKKEKLNRITTFCLMGIMGAMIGVALYAAITQMYASVGSF